MDEEKVTFWKTHFSRESREELAVRLFQHRAAGESWSPEYTEARRRLLDAMGGPPTLEAMRAWLDSHFAERDAQPRPYLAERDARPSSGIAAGPGQHLVQKICPHCGEVTTQTRHGFTVSGGLWKGHPCLCGGWECRGCGVVLDRRDECCR